MQQTGPVRPESPHPSPIRLFTALTRVVRDEPMDEAVRARAFDRLTRLGDQVFLPGFGPALDAFIACAGEDRRLHAALAPHMTALDALRQASQPIAETVR